MANNLQGIFHLNFPKEVVCGCCEKQINVGDAVGQSVFPADLSVGVGGRVLEMRADGSRVVMVCITCGFFAVGRLVANTDGRGPRGRLQRLSPDASSVSMTERAA